MGAFEDAAKSYLKALAIKPGYAEAHNNLGSTLRAQEKPDEAVASFQKAISLKPEFAEAHSNLGNTLKNWGARTRPWPATAAPWTSTPDARTCNI